MKLQLDQTLTDQQVCEFLKIQIPEIYTTDRIAVTKAVANFQAKKAFAVSAFNKSIRTTGVQLQQVSHTTYKVVTVKDKKARLSAQVNRMKAALKTY